MKTKQVKRYSCTWKMENGDWFKWAHVWSVKVMSDWVTQNVGPFRYVNVYNRKTGAFIKRFYNPGKAWVKDPVSGRWEEKHFPGDNIPHYPKV